MISENTFRASFVEYCNAMFDVTEKRDEEMWFSEIWNYYIFGGKP